MNRWTPWSAMLVLGMCGTTYAAAQQAGDYVRMLQERVEADKQQVAVSQQNLTRVQHLYDAGSVSASDVEAAQKVLSAQQYNLSQADFELTSAENREMLRRPVTVKFDHAGIRQLAASLSQATGVPIVVDREVPANVTTTVDAQDVPLATVLEVVADRNNLRITPELRGVALRIWPTLNGAAYKGPLAPWSDDWNVAPTAMIGAAPGGPQAGRPGAVGGGGFGGGFAQDGGGGPAGAMPGGPMGPGMPGGQMGPGMMGPGMMGPGMMGPGMMGPGMMGPGMMGGMMPGFAPGPFNVTSMGEHLFVLAEAGTDGKGRPGIWLTAYTFEGGKFKRGATTFHATSNPTPPMPSPGSPGNPVPTGRVYPPIPDGRGFGGGPGFPGGGGAPNGGGLGGGGRAPQNRNGFGNPLAPPTVAPSPGTPPLPDVPGGPGFTTPPTVSPGPGAAPPSPAVPGVGAPPTASPGPGATPPSPAVPGVGAPPTASPGSGTTPPSPAVPGVGAPPTASPGSGTTPPSPADPGNSPFTGVQPAPSPSPVR